MKYPKIRFHDSTLLLGTLEKDLLPVYTEHGWEHLFEKDFLVATKERYESAWRPHEETILRGMCEAFDLEFNQNIIDIYPTPLRNSLSTPMMIATNFKDEHVINIISHELIHRLTGDNTLMGVDADSVKTKEKIYLNMFGANDPFKLYEHIIVHAALKYLYLDVLKDPIRLEWDIEFTKKNEPYRLAWEYVQSYDYKEIVKGFDVEVGKLKP